MYKVLIIEDDTTITTEIERHLRKWEYDVKCIAYFDEVLSEFAAFNPQLVLLDVNLPFYNGYHWCTEIRKISKVPIIFISSLSENMNVVMAIQAGGDDFIGKPFDLNVLTAKIHAVLRRAYNFGNHIHLIEHRGAILDINAATLFYLGQTIELTKNDTIILQTLMENKGRIISRDTLMIKLWQTDSYVDENTLSVNITRLRRKLYNIRLDHFIETKRGAGYLVK